MTVPEINTVCYVGAGTMGCYNSLAAALSGYRVVLFDMSEATLEQVGRRHQEFAAMLVGGGYCAQEDVPAALQRVSLATDLAEAVAGADLVSESVFERLDVKRDIHRQLDELCSDATIITTNSSILQVSEMEDVLANGSRFAALHSHLGSPLVDIVPGPRTEPSVVDVLKRYVLSLKSVPLVLKKEHPGYVLNAILGPLLSTAQALVLTDVADIESVDRAWMSSRNAPMGPFGMIDLFGLNLILDSWEHKGDGLYYPELRQQAAAFLRAYVERGETGMQTGRGFYRYPEPAYQQPGFLDAQVDTSRLQAALTVALVGNAVLIAAAGVADPAEIDRAWQVGTYLDAGPFSILENLGHDTFIAMLDAEVKAQRFRSNRAEQVRSYLRPVAESAQA